MNAAFRRKVSTYSRVLGAPALAGVLAAAGRAGAQSKPPASPLRVTVRVADSAGAPVSAANVSVVRGMADVRATGATDVAGRVTLSVPSAEGDLELVVRKIGYVRSDQFFRADTQAMVFDVVLQRAAQTLAPVQVTEQEDIKRKAYFIDADDIAKHGDELFDATDILRKLRPDMICGRECDPMEAVAKTARNPVRACPVLMFQQQLPINCPADNSPPSLATNVWVNGQWIRTMAYDSTSVCQIGRRGILAGLLRGSMEVLCEILPEHIEQMTYVDEYDNSVGKIGSNGGLFIVLKPGVVYKPGHMSYVADAPRHGASTTVARQQSAAGASANADSSVALPAYRHRLLGVFDQLTGEPVAGARVIDVATGTYATVPEQGVVSLAFLPEGTSLVRITAAGHEDLTLSVEIGASATTPLTLLLEPHKAGATRPPSGD